MTSNTDAFPMSGTITRCVSILGAAQRNDSKEVVLDIRDFRNLFGLIEFPLVKIGKFTLETGKLGATYSIPMILTCPSCGERHIDEAAFAEVPHHTHACQSCGIVWRPAKVNTHGVHFLPGYTNEKTA